MPPVDSILAVLLAGILLSVTPGPSMLYVLSRSVGQSRAAGVASAIGLAGGGVVLAVATALGLGQLFSEIPALVVVLKYCGSAYLAWLGASMIFNARTEASVDLKVEQVERQSYGSIVWQGVVVELLNPKTVLFFALFLPPFVEVVGDQASSNGVQSQLLVLGILVPLTAVPSDTLIAFMGGTLTRSVNHHRKTREWLGWIGGLTMLAIALNLHLGFV